MSSPTKSKNVNYKDISSRVGNFVPQQKLNNDSSAKQQYSPIPISIRKNSISSVPLVQSSQSNSTSTSASTIKKVPLTPRQNQTRTQPPSHSKKTITDLAIVLDLDETFINSNENIQHLFDSNLLTDESLSHIKDRLFTFTYNDIYHDELNLDRSKREYLEQMGNSIAYWCLKRHHMDEFLDFCFEYFKTVIVWSAGTANYVNLIVKLIFKKNKPHFVYTQDDCADMKHPTRPYYKPLQKIANDHPELCSMSNMVIIDDRKDNFKENPDNGILIPAYDPRKVYEKTTNHKEIIDELGRYDDALLKLMSWFKRDVIVKSTDIRTHPKHFIFNTPPTMMNYLYNGNINSYSPKFKGNYSPSYNPIPKVPKISNYPNKIQDNYYDRTATYNYVDEEGEEEGEGEEGEEYEEEYEDNRPRHNIYINPFMPFIDDYGTMYLPTLGKYYKY